jgi:isopenicillin N synthase-like dioxygenase
MAASGALPVVDLAPFFTDDGHDGGVSRASATEAVRQACRTHGFFRAVNHGVPAHLMARALELSAAFFALPDEDKASARAAEGAEAPLPAGYARQPAHSADKNEYVLVFDPKLGFNVYPGEPAGFRSVQNSRSMENLHAKIGVLLVCLFIRIYKKKTFTKSIHPERRWRSVTPSSQSWGCSSRRS